jgi:hypothetical protein
MDSASTRQSQPLKTVRNEQLSLPLPEAEEDDCEIANAIAEVSIEVQERIEVIQQVMAVRGSDQYGKVQRQAAKKLGLSVRSRLGHLAENFSAPYLDMSVATWWVALLRRYRKGRPKQKRKLVLRCCN